MSGQHGQSIVRCPWAGTDDPEYARYHDEEWGVPLTDDRAIFEKIVLEGFQSGLSWRTILAKRDNFRRAFHGFDVERIAGYGERDVARLMADAGIVRNRLKIAATIDNARACLRLREETSLTAYVWSFVEGRPIINRRTAHDHVPAETDVSRNLSKGLKSQGFRFVGPTTMYAFMQSAGLVNDHLTACHRHAPCAELQRTLRLPA